MIVKKTHEKIIKLIITVYNLIIIRIISNQILNFQNIMFVPILFVTKNDNTNNNIYNKDKFHLNF